MKNSDWKDRLNVVYSTNPDYNYEMDNSGSASFNTSLTVFLPSMISSWFSKQTSFKNLPRRPLAMFSIICCGKLAAFSAETVAMISLALAISSSVIQPLALLLSICSSLSTCAGLIPAFFKATSTALSTCSFLVLSIATCISASLQIQEHRLHQLQ